MKPGSYVEVYTKDKNVFNGLVMQSSNPSILSLKLDSGYNIGLDRKNISKIKEIKRKFEVISKKEEEVKFNKNLKTITILHTGGTVASRVNYQTGAVSPSYTPEDLIKMVPELNGVVNIKSRLLGNMFSEDIRFYHYNIIAKEIEKELKMGVDGIIITHGTDTIAVSSCALALSLENLDKPVLFIGAQRSSDRPSSDASMNLLCAVNFILKSNFNEVAICMHSRSNDEFCDILPACKTKKLHTSRRDAFKAVNASPIARVSKGGDVKFLINYHKNEHKEKLKLRLFDEKLKIGILKAHPNMFAFEFRDFAKFDGIVLEGTGMAGNFPINVVDLKTKEHKLIYNELKKLAKKVPVVISSNCIFGRINMNVYDTGRKLQEAGVLGNLTDMITETAFIKLAWLLSNYKKNEIKKLIDVNLRGEISKKVNYEEEII